MDPVSTAGISVGTVHSADGDGIDRNWNLANTRYGVFVVPGQNGLEHGSRHFSFSGHRHGRFGFRVWRDVLAAELSAQTENAGQRPFPVAELRVATTSQ